MIYVDRFFGGGHGKWAGGGHMQADTVEELHAFAARLGLKREWFQERPGCPDLDHYDLTASKREMALRLGAIAEAPEAGVARRRAIRAAARARAEHVTPEEER